MQAWCILLVFPAACSYGVRESRGYRLTARCVIHQKEKNPLQKVHKLIVCELPPEEFQRVQSPGLEKQHTEYERVKFKLW